MSTQRWQSFCLGFNLNGHMVWKPTKATKTAYESCKKAYQISTTSALVIRVPMPRTPFSLRRPSHGKAITCLQAQWMYCCIAPNAGRLLPEGNGGGQTNDQTKRVCSAYHSSQRDVSRGTICSTVSIAVTDSTL